MEQILDMSKCQAPSPIDPSPIDPLKIGDYLFRRRSPFLFEKQSLLQMEERLSTYLSGLQDTFKFEY